MRKVMKLLLLFGVSWATVRLLISGLMSCGPLYLPFGYTVNFARGGGKAVAESDFGTRIRVPRGFSIAPFAEGVDNARWLLFTSAGDLLVSSPRQGKVFLLERDNDRDRYADGRRTLLEGLDRPHGLAIRGDWLYVAETGAVLRVRFDPTTRSIQGDIERIITDIPAGENHWTRTIGFGPDGGLFVSVGSSCNVCIEDNPKRAAILRYDADGSDGRIFASGLRNAVGFDWDPHTGEMYATDNGRDLLGDNFPPCELNHVVDGGFYGWPYANGDKVPDPDYGDATDKVEASIPPVYGFDAHNAPLGITFYNATMFPEHYRNAAFVALHGSWNRSEKSGYKVVAVWIDGDDARAEDFVVGFERNEDVIGRPVDVAVGPDGALYISDDFAGSVYRVAYGEDAGNRAFAKPTTVTHKDPLAEVSTEALAAARSDGAAAWEANGCSGCHLPGGEAETYRPLADLAARYDIETLATFLNAPQPPMPVFDFNERQRRTLAIYLLDRFS